MTNSQSSNTKQQSFYEKIIGPPSYETYCQRDFWSLDEFIALASGLEPEDYQNHKELRGTTDLRKAKRVLFAKKLICLFWEHVANNPIMCRNLEWVGQLTCSPS